MLSMSTSTVGRLLASLTAVGMLSQDAGTRLYQMGPKVLVYSMVYTASLNIRGVARPLLEKLFGITNETVSLYILAGEERICAECIESTERLRVVVRVGEHMPLHAGSAGKVLLAFMPEEQSMRILAKPLESMASGTIVSAQKLLEELAVIRSTGYAISHSERFEDVIGLAAPIFDSTGQIIAAMNVAGPRHRFTDSVVAATTAPLMEFASQASYLLGYRAGRSPLPHKKQPQVEQSIV
jgi:DNA-binding IclR family transcriptional regulator